MMADIYQTEIKIPNYLEEATSMGAAILAGIGAGLFKDFSVTDRFIHIDKKISPIPANVKKYQELIGVFDKTYDHLKEVYADLSNLNL